LIAPIPTGPGQFEIVSSPVTFSWDYFSSCVPGHYDVLISDDFDFTNPILKSGGALRRSSSFTRYLSLDPGKQYWWNITAVSESPLGIPGPSSDLMTFIAGPVCTPADLVAPNLLYPFMGSMVDTAFPILAFETAGNCASNYWIDLQTDQNFGGLNYLVSNSPFPNTQVTPDALYGLPDCTEFYWRVWATIDGVDGPISPTYSFNTDFSGNCIYGEEVMVIPPTPEPTQPEPISTPTPTPIPEDPGVDRCALFDEESISLTMLDIAPGSTLQTVYLTIPGGVPGLELAIPGDSGLWEYNAALGSAVAEACSFEGYAERLYCAFELSPAALGTSQELFVFVNGCLDAFYYHPQVSIFEPAPVCSEDLSESECIASGGEFGHSRLGNVALCTCPSP
jgi:hypothetical protein